MDLKADNDWEVTARCVSWQDRENVGLVLPSDECIVLDRHANVSERDLFSERVPM